MMLPMDYADSPQVMTVSVLARYLRELLETDEVLQDVWVHGEVSDYRTPSSLGHCYFTLKDGEAQLPCAFFKQARLRSTALELRNGMALAVNGHVSLYERNGKLQLYVETIEPLGEGALFLRFEELKARLAAEGLFDEDRKRPLPLQPARIGIVTSPQAAALRDMLRVLQVRYPLAEVLLSPSLVQGPEAPAAVVAALDLLNEHGEADVIIIARGGGSIEELWAFNEEVVARAIARSRIPVISGIGHEVDTTIADYVADYRASTPTAAATAAVPNIAHLIVEVQQRQETLMHLVGERLEVLQMELAGARRDLQRASPRHQLDRRRQQLDDMTASLQERMRYMLSLRRAHLQGVATLLHSLSPLLTIARGYAIVRREDDQAVVSSVQAVKGGDGLTIQVADGQVRATVCD